MIYVTHDQVEAMTMADKIVLLNAGHVEQFAQPEDLYARPATLFAAGFIGTPPMNLLPLSDGELAEWARSNLAGKLPQTPLDTLMLGVRPEKITLADSGPTAEVISLEYLGADSLIACRLAGREATIRLSGKVRLESGERIHLSWPAAESHLFDSRSGRRSNE
jgi:sn-glycerol 3-phosphate transport system ATP-binding protein